MYETYETRTVGEIGVDSGQVLLIDPCYIKKDTLGNEEMNHTRNKRSEVSFLNDPTLNNKKNFYTNVCERTTVGEGFGNTQNGFATATTHGDGTYKVKGIFKDGVLQGFYVNFSDDTFTVQAEETEEDYYW
tara:strand:+ start:53 stop:445 length:393 start_codon:yes stop_codon:yes gene_type:complete